MGGWIANHVWYRDGTTGSEPDSVVPIRDSAARAEVHWEYVHVNFHWNLELISDETDEGLDRMVRHEIAHALINEMRMWGPSTHRDEQARDEALKHEERVATELAMVLLWCRLQGEADARRKAKKAVFAARTRRKGRT